jgi:hypothetical protein
MLAGDAEACGRQQLRVQWSTAVSPSRLAPGVEQWQWLVALQRTCSASLTKAARWPPLRMHMLSA